MQGKDYYVYVQASDGTPLMPTRRFGWVRRSLRDGKAVAVATRPFTIRLNYEPETKVTQPVTLGIDPGRTNIGMAAVTDDGTCLYAAECETRNKEIPKLMAERRSHRQASRRGERLVRKRRAKAHGTIMRQGQIERLLPGYETPVVVKDIINTEAKFNNRKRIDGWLTPTARQLLQTHVSLVRKVMKLLPVTQVCLELNKFAFMELEAGGRLKDRAAYANGPMHGYADEKEALNVMQNGKCQLCRECPIETVHHIYPRHRNGSDTLANKAGLCRKCHGLVHKDPAAAAKLRAVKAGMRKKYGALSILNQVIPYLADELSRITDGNLAVTTGWESKEARESIGAGKEHYVDAYCIAAGAVGAASSANSGKVPESCFHIRQFRRQNRQRINNQRERSYYCNGELVAKNRKPRFEQKCDALSDWYIDAIEKYGSREAEAMLSRMAVKKSVRRYNTKGRLLPGGIIGYKGRRFLVTGQISNGQYFLSPDMPGVRIPARQSTILAENTGLVYVS